MPIPMPMPMPICTRSLVARARLAPFHEVAKQSLAIVGGRGRPAACAHERVELFLPRDLPVAMLVEPVLRRRKPRPARQRGGEIDLAPFRMARLQLREPREEGVDEFPDLGGAIGVL